MRIKILCDQYDKLALIIFKFKDFLFRIKYLLNVKRSFVLLDESAIKMACFMSEEAQCIKCRDKVGVI